MQSNFWSGSKYLDQHKTFWDLYKRTRHLLQLAFDKKDTIFGTA